MKSKDIIYEMRERCDAFEKSFFCISDKDWYGRRDRTTKSKEFISNYSKLWDRSRRAALLRLHG